MTLTEHTPDGYVRIAEAELPSLQIQHLTSEVDMSIAVAESLTQPAPDLVTGFTEWSGDWKGAIASLGWDWAFIHGKVALINLPELRTNILLLGQDGSAQSPLFCRLRLSQWLETLPWQAEVLRELDLDLGKDRS